MLYVLATEMFNALQNEKDIVKAFKCHYASEGAKLAVENSNNKRAIEYVEKAISYEPDNYDWWLDYGNYLRNSNRTAEARAAWEKAVELDPGSFEAQYTLGRLYAADTARSSEAEQALLKAFKMRKNDVNVKILLCNVAMGANSPRTTGYLGLLKSSPELAASAAFNNQYAVNYVRRGNYRAAKEYFVKAFQAGREEPEIVLNVARFYDGCLGDRITAVKLYREYLRIAGKDADGKAEAEARLARLARRR